MKRVFEIDVLVCPYCEGVRKLIAFLTDGAVVRRILLHLGLDSEPPILSPARVHDEGVFAREAEAESRESPGSVRSLLDDCGREGVHPD